MSYAAQIHEQVIRYWANEFDQEVLRYYNKNHDKKDGTFTTGKGGGAKGKSGSVRKSAGKTASKPSPTKSKTKSAKAKTPAAAPKRAGRPQDLTQHWAKEASKHASAAAQTFPYPVSSNAQHASESAKWHSKGAKDRARTSRGWQASR